MIISTEIKELVSKHIEILKYNFPELLIKVIAIKDEVFIYTNSLTISNYEEYELLIYSFIEEYQSLGLFNIFWGVDTSVNSDELELIKHASISLNDLFFKYNNSIILNQSDKWANSNEWFNIKWGTEISLLDINHKIQTEYPTAFFSTNGGIVLNTQDKKSLIKANPPKKIISNNTTPTFDTKISNNNFSLAA